MASAAQSDKRSSIARDSRLNDAARTVEPREIPVDLTSLIAPYKKQGRLSLRIERLPANARFSRGCRNNDGKSWSLASDELADLTYQPPAGADEPQKLAVRIIGLASGDTLAVLDFIVSSGAEIGAPEAQVPSREGPRDVAQLERLRDELSKAHDALAARDAEVSQARQEAERAAAVGAKQQIESELASARAAWTIELNERLASVTAQAASQLQRHREAWEAAQAARVTQSEGTAQTHIAEAREKWEREAQAALLKAEQAWKADEAARLAALEAQWQATSATALADAREQWQQEAQHRLLKAEQGWKADEASRLAAAEALWQANAAKAVADARAQSEAPPVPDHDIELRGLREELAALQTTLAERDAAAVLAAKVAERLREESRREMQDALASAERAWKVDEAARLAAAEARWQETSAKALSAVSVSKPVKVDDHASSSELRGLRQRVAEMEATLAEAASRRESAEAALAQLRQKAKDELAAVRGTIAVRDAELAQLRSASPVPRERAEPQGVGQPFRIRELLNKAPEERPVYDKQRMTRDAVIAACVGIAAVFFYPEISGLIFGEPPSPPAKPAAAIVAPAPVAAPAIVERHMNVVRDTKMRASPLADAAVVSSLQHGLDVAFVEERGKWSLVRADDKTGWVKSSFLKDAAPPAAPALGKP